MRGQETPENFYIQTELVANKANKANGIFVRWQIRQIEYLSGRLESPAH